MKCAHCSNPLEPGVTVCPKCGLTTTPLRDGDERTVHGVKLSDLLSGRYRLEAKLGEGGMGTVYLAHDLELDRQVAVKLLAKNLVDDAEVVERFEREAKLTAKLDHPNVVPIYDVGRHQGRPYIVMKRLDGDTLAGLLRSKGGLKAEETLKLIEQIAFGLDHIHSKGFIHRDIKAGNIFVGPDGQATILDFGILRPARGGEGLTRTGMVMGTPHYMAPEQALGSKDVDHRVDLYALAVVAFEALSGTLPFEADSELRLIQMQAHQPPPDLLERAPWIPKPVAEVMKRALAKRPDDRYSSGAEFHRAMKDAYARAGQNANDSKPPGQVAPLLAPHTAPSWRNRDGSTPAPPAATPGLPPLEPIPLTALGPPQPGPVASPAPAPAVAAPPSASPQPPLPAASGPDTDDFKRAVRPSRLPYAVVGVAIAVAIGLFFARPWEQAQQPVVGHNPPARDAGPLAVVALPDAGSESPDVLDAGEALAALDADAGEPEEDGGTELADLASDAGHKVVHVKVHPESKNGKLNVITTHQGEPYWAQVSIDGKLKGRTPLLLELPVGRYSVKVERPGFKSETREIRVASGRQAVVRIDLVE